MKNIVLVGFMGTGKTTIARALAEKTGMRYVSIDAMIEEREGMRINDIFAQKGEPHFRQCERAAVCDVAVQEGHVIDAGGGVVLFPENVAMLKKKGVIVCLWTEPGDIYDRVKKHTHRPLLNVADPKKTITELLEKRKPYYERADFHINTSSLSIDEAVQGILDYARTNE